jgi:NAD(P)H-hydrate epimerase
MEFEARRIIPPIVSIDIPSGWDVNTGNPEGRYFEPRVILSLTAPKVGIRSFTLPPKSSASTPGRHFIGGRFIPEEIEERFDLALPAYPADLQIVEVTGFKEVNDEAGDQ